MSGENVAALNLDINQQQIFIRYFHSLPEKGPSTVRFFNRIDYYTLHEDDANLASNFSSKIIKHMGEAPKLSYVCLSKHDTENFLRELLLVRNYRVEIYEKIGKSNNEWQLEFRGSPGNLTQFEEMLFENANVESSNSVMGVAIGPNNNIAVSNVNTTDLTFAVCEFVDNECFTNLEAILAQLGPKECIIPIGTNAALKNILERNGILVAQRKRSDFTTENIIQDLNRLLFFQINRKRDANLLPETNLKEAMSCLQAVVKFLHLTESDTNFNQYRLEKMNSNQYVHVDNAALYALNILPKPVNNDDGSPVFSKSNKSHSLFGILNHCVTPQGRRLLEQWIKQPQKDINIINERLDIVEALVNDSEARSSINQQSLTKIPDLMILSKKLSGKKAKLQDCYRLYQAINHIPSLINILRKLNQASVNDVFVSALCELFSDMKKYQAMIETMLDFDGLDRGEVFLKSNVDPELEQLHNKKMKIEETMQTLLKKAGRDLSLDEGKSIKLDCNPQLGYFFRITKKDEPVLRQAKCYKIIDAVASGVRFTNDKLKSLNEVYEGINQKYEIIQKETVDEILNIAIGYADTVRSINMILAALDVLVSFAIASVTARIRYIRPTLKTAEDRVLKLKKLRHPCLEQQDFIPNDIQFSNENTFYIITGPNMCGKSTYIRSVGVAMLMAQIGCFVPCEAAEISIVDGILARVGADDSQLKGVSTFMLEMIETCAILKTATKNSLVIIDELGRGTSTYDGCGIAYAIAEYLAIDVKSFSLFATHFHKITKLADRCQTVRNVHVSAVTTNDTITPLYKVTAGECDKSYGIHCAKIAEFPDDVLDEANNYLKELEEQDGMKFIQDLGAGERKRIVEDGNKVVRDVLKRLKEAAINGGKDEVNKELNKLKEELNGNQNLFVKNLLS